MESTELKKWVLSDEFKTIWKEAFSSLRGMFSDYQVLGRLTSRREKGNQYLWMLLETPYPGIYLISFEIPVDLSDLPIYLKVWVDERFHALYEKLDNMPDPIILRQRAISFKSQVPTGSFKADLERRGISLRGVRYKVDGQKILINKSSARTQLHAMGSEFCSLILNVLTEKQPVHSQEAPVLVGSTRPTLAKNQETDDALPKVDLDELVENEDLVPFVGANETGELIDKDPRFLGISEKTKVALINARVGQGGYRRRMLKLWGGRCALTGCDIHQVLIASHAKPWSECCVAECLNEYNGLLLTASLDRLFDAGLISFAEKGELLVHPTLSISQKRDIGLVKSNRLRLICEEHQKFLAFHRNAHGFEK